MKKDMQIILEVNDQAENFYEDAVSLGDHAAYVLRDKERQSSHRSQLTGLENIAESALKVSDILDYIKRQTARNSQWQKAFPGHHSGESFGDYLRNYLEKDLAVKRDAICSKERLDFNKSSDEGRTQRRRVYLLLIRQFIRQMVIEYEYRIKFGDTKKGAS